MELAAKSKINVIDGTIRKRKISSLLSNKKNIIGTFPVVVHSKKEIFSVVTIDIVLPVYNMMNGRTGDTQEAFIKQNAKKPNFFSKGQESNSAQREQHGLLAIEAKGGGKKEHDVFREFEKIKEFDPSKPILLTNDGVIINGNRRLCAMRELYFREGGAKKFSNFASVPCAIVEKDISEKEFHILEDRVQVQKDLKQEYRWTAMLIKIKNEIKLGFSPEEVARNMGEEVSKIKKAIAKLEIIDEHLDKDLDKDGDYSQVEGQEQIWNDVGALLTSGDVKGDDDKKDIVSNITRRIAISRNIEDKSKHDIWEVLLHKKNIITTAKKIIKAHGKKVEINENENESLKDVGDEVTELANQLTSIKINPGNNVIQNIFEDLSEDKKAKYVLKITDEILGKINRIINKTVPEADRAQVKRNLLKISSKSESLAGRFKKYK